MKYLKLFETTADYTAYVATDYEKPNVSYILESGGDVMYNPIPETRLITVFNVTSTSNPTKIGYYEYISAFTKIEIDGVEQPSVVSAYTFSATGEHTVKYTLADPTQISDYLFYECYNLVSVTIPNSVTSIGGSAFYGCSGMTSISIPNSVTSIGYGAFENCYSLTALSISNNVESIGELAFLGCSKCLVSISVESGNPVYDSRDNCNAIIKTQTNELILGCKNTTVPNSVTSIGDSAFSSCSGLTSITVPNSVTSIGDGAFSGCRGLTSINIPSGVTRIGSYTFYNCSGLTSIDIPSGVTSIGQSAFQNCSGLTSVVIPSGVTTITSYTFSECSSLSSVTIPDGVTSIGNDAFRNCSSLTSVTIPNNVRRIGDYTFYNCSSLASINVGSGITNINACAFQNCSSLASITCNAITAPSIYTTTFQNVKTGGTLYVPSGANYANWMQNANYYLGKYGWTKVEQ